MKLVRIASLYLLAASVDAIKPHNATGDPAQPGCVVYCKGATVEVESVSADAVAAALENTESPIESLIQSMSAKLEKFLEPPQFSGVYVPPAGSLPKPSRKPAKPPAS